MESHNLRPWLVVIVLVTLAFGYIGLPIPSKWGANELEFLAQKKINLGLDLQGGSEIRVEFDLANEAAAELRNNRAKQIEAIGKAFDTLMRRINIHGVKEPRMQIYGETQILIQLPGHDQTETTRVKDILKKAGKLEFKMASDDQDNLQGTSPPGTYVVASEQEQNVHEPQQIRVKKEAPLKGEDIEDANAVVDPQRGWQVSLKFQPRGARVFADLTAQNVHKKFAIILDGKLVSAPVINEPIPSGNAVISGGSEPDMEKWAKDLATVLKSGSLAAPLKIAGENYVGPTLGQDSIRRGFYAGGFAIIAVFLFMWMYYRTLGMIANVAMFANVMLLMGILALFGATLTLPGIAGIVLTLGMAVDANILINERIREEAAKGRTPIQAFDAGYDRAFMTIFDSNITTLFAGIILYYAGSGPIQGFAVTLSVGIATTMITALWFSKIITRYMVLSGSLTEYKMMQVFHNPKYDFSGKGKLCFTASVICIFLGFGFFLYRGKENLSIDFRGGTLMQLRFNGETDIDAVRTGISGIKGEGGRPKYGDAEVQRVFELAGAKETASGSIFGIRVGSSDSDELKKDLSAAFAGKVPPSPFEELGDIENSPRYAGAYHLNVGLREPMAQDEFQKKLKAALSGISEADLPPMVLKPTDQGSATFHRATFEIAVKAGGSTMSEVENALKGAKDLNIAPDPFPFVSSIGASVASEMKSNAAKALIASWIAMIIYLAFRFEFSYGVAAVIALIHDVMFTLGFVALVNWLLPKTLGIDLDMGLSAVAAYLTIVGYSVNDTIVVFDRIRENLKEMKREPFSVVMDVSVNQTLSRTILTSLTVFLTVVVLFALTARSGGGIASFAFPMIVGVVVGTYSSVFIASPVVMWWRGNRPAAA